MCGVHVYMCARVWCIYVAHTFFFCYVVQTMIHHATPYQCSATRHRPRFSRDKAISLPTHDAPIKSGRVGHCLTGRLRYRVSPKFTCHDEQCVALIYDVGGQGAMALCAVSLAVPLAPWTGSSLPANDDRFRGYSCRQWSSWYCRTHSYNYWLSCRGHAARSLYMRAYNVSVYIRSSWSCYYFLCYYSLPTTMMILGGGNA